MWWFDSTSWALCGAVRISQVLQRRTLSKLLQALEAVTEKDLKSIDDQIAALRTQLDEQTAALKAQIEGLSAARKIVAARLGIRDPKVEAMLRAKQEKKAARTAQQSQPDNAELEDAGDELKTRKQVYREQIYRHLTMNGPTRVAVLCKALEIPNGSIGAVVKHEWFTNDNGVIGIARAGKS